MQIVSKADQLFRSHNHRYKGCEIDSSNIKAVKDLVTNAPSNIGQLRRVLGPLGYYRRYVGFSSIAKPLFDLLKKDNIKSSSKVLKASTSIHWRRQHQKTIETLRTAITAPPLSWVFNPGNNP